MNIKVKAATIVAVYAVISIVAILAIKLVITYIPINVLGVFGAVVIGGVMLTLFYTIVLDQLKYKAKFKEVAKK
jgi:hypothetical protein